MASCTSTIAKVCQPWEQCNPQSASCDLKPGMCNTGRDCILGKKCDLFAHTCEGSSPPPPPPPPPDPGLICDSKSGKGCEYWQTCDPTTKHCQTNTPLYCTKASECKVLGFDTCDLYDHKCSGKGPAPTPPPPFPSKNCASNEVSIGGACYPSHNACQGNNTSPSGFCDATNHINKPQNYQDMSMYIAPLLQQ